MLNISTPHNIMIVRLDDPEYVAWRRRMADKRPSRGGPRQAGEVMGGLAEQCVQHYLKGFVPLQEERILTWEQRLRNGRAGRLYRELDGVWTIDHESLCLFEIKFTFPENMERGVGIKQLRIAQETLFASGRYQYILLRLVYISDDPVPVLDDLPSLEPTDENEELGVIWIPTAAIETAAQELEITLPENWREPESREGYVEDADREEWRQYADTSAREAGEPGEDAEEAAVNNPLAEALRRAMGGEGG
jgi:hypothetical protein